MLGQGLRLWLDRLTGNVTENMKHLRVFIRFYIREINSSEIIQFISSLLDTNMIAFLYFTILIVPTLAGNVSVSLTPRAMSEHPLHKAWLCCTPIGVIGFVLNSLVLFIFIKERSSLVTSVNTMIMSVEKLIYTLQSTGMTSLGWTQFIDWFEVSCYIGACSASCRMRTCSQFLASGGTW